MANAQPIQAGFIGGQFSPLMQGRVDQPNRAYACEVLQNFFATVQGPAFKRSGTRFVVGMRRSVRLPSWSVASGAMEMIRGVIQSPTDSRFRTSGE